MVLPLYDHTPFKWATPPYVTWLLIATNVIVYLLEISAPQDDAIRLVQSAGLIPAFLVGSAYVGATFPTLLTLVSYTFLHANFMHIFGNMIFLWVFGDDIEEALGHWRFLIFYLACGIGAGLAFVVSDPVSTTNLIGASGAVAGVIAAYLLFRPCASVTVLVFFVPVRLRAFWLIGGWAIWQIVEVASRAQDGVAYWAHVGGLATGAILFVLMRPPGVQLFECIEWDSLPASRRHDAL